MEGAEPSAGPAVTRPIFTFASGGLSENNLRDHQVRQRLVPAFRNGVECQPEALGVSWRERAGASHYGHALAQDYREVIILRQMEGLSFPDVASRMGKTVKSVEKLWMRALARLRRVLRGDS